MENTKKLYYADAHLQCFTARVLDCQKVGDNFDVALDQTAFYPEGGGQPWDTGILGGRRVLEVHEKQGVIFHRCDGFLEPGTQVEGQIDWQRRLDFTQQHSGEHIVSGLIHKRFGYHNVGFHMGAAAITIDFDGVISAQVLSEIEAEANEAVWRDLPVQCWFPPAEELARLPYRSKRPLEGAVRLVEVPGYDLCACCGTHVKYTGEIGLIKLLSVVKFHEGVRIEMLCGRRALAYLSDVLEQNRQVSQAFSAKVLETGEAARKMNENLAALKYRVVALENQLFENLAAQYQGRGNVCHFEPGLSGDGVRRLADALGKSCGGRAIVLSGSDDVGYQYAICQPGADLRQFNRDWTQALWGKGGGKPHFQQGSLRAARRDIEAYLTAASQ